MLGNSNKIAIGTTLTRSFKGKEHTVIATYKGFLYEGRTYKSLTKVATEIAGYRITGQKFFCE